MPTMETMERLAYATKLDPGWLGFGLSSVGLSPHINIAPGFDGDALIENLLSILKGTSGVIDDVYKYLDPIGSHEWRNMLRQPDFRSVVSSLPLADLIQFLASVLGSEEPCDIVGLGCGTAEREISLVKKLLARRRRDLRLLLLDISVNLLSTAVHASDDFSRSHAVPVLALLGDFHALPEYGHLLTGDSPRKRLITMFGYTFSNLDNEIQFLRRSMSWVNHEDYLVLDLPAAAIDSSDPAQIIRSDRVLAAKHKGEWHDRASDFLTGPLRRNVRDVVDCRLQTELDLASCVIPGSYAIVHKATLKLKSGEEKRFVVGYSKRYVLEKLDKHMQGEGWQLVKGLRYGPDDWGILAVFQRHDPRPKRGSKAK